MQLEDLQIDERLLLSPKRSVEDEVGSPKFFPKNVTN
jgi:hypothetical protein